MIEIVPAKPQHIGRIARLMREHDKQECSAGGRTPKNALRQSLRGSALAFTALENGQPEAMFGLVIADLMGGLGYPWMLGTDRVAAHPRLLIEMGRRVIGDMAGICPRLENYVSDDNVLARRWLARMGFSFDEDTLTMNGVVLRRFHQCATR